MDFLRHHDLPCRDEDPELFFPVGTGGPALAQIAEAKAVCRRCPHTQACLAWALESGQDAGVWGGMSADERRALTRRRGRAEAQRPAGGGPNRGSPERARWASNDDKRARAAHAIDQQRQPRDVVAAAFGVSVRTVERWLAHERAARTASAAATA